jgi:pimeloyl-ACP methyl ester carboxylesterase
MTTTYTPEQTASRGHTVQISDIEMYYEEYGAGKPLVLLHGARDRFFPVGNAVSIYRSIPDAALWIIPGGDHAPIYDTTVPFTSSALRFLDGPKGQIGRKSGTNHGFS